jgi:hypothetical protein
MKIDEFQSVWECYNLVCIFVVCSKWALLSVCLSTGIEFLVNAWLLRSES